MDLLAASLARSAELFPQAWDPASDMVRLIRLTEADYRRASFLDDRILTPQTPNRTIPASQLLAAIGASGMAENCSFIFHIGHVGSTLLSRLLGEHPNVLALREPAILRTLAEARLEPKAGGVADDDYLGAFLKLWSRTFRTSQQACVKATSFASELAGSILARPSAPSAIFMFVPAEAYLATILGAPNSPAEARALAEMRLMRLHRRLGVERWHVADLSEGEIIAMSWACEMCALCSAAEAAPDRVLWLNFDSFLQSPAKWLAASLRHMGHAAPPEQVAGIVSGREMRRYSKAPEHSYDANLRRDLLDQARQQQAKEISRGLAWLDAAAGEFPLIQSIRLMS
ncbi:MAG: hypothetical protein JO056_05775 [Alphaproteobacteria bacterium]|nr:hypothetical protein [Alphaproteobacteria bacterium]